MGARAIRMLSLGLSLLFLCGCSVDEFRNLQRLDRDPCLAAGGKPITSKFCNLHPSKDPVNDAAVSDAAMSDAAMSGDATVDAGTVYVSCEGLEEGTEEECYTGKDKASALQMPCHSGKHTCHDGQWGDCIDEHVPAQEDCNGLDDDCDGKSDEALSNSPCSVADAHGVCEQGVRICFAGGWKCAQITYPGSETCNGMDDDCDGTTDEDSSHDCYTGDNGCAKANNGEYICNGVCKPGVVECVDGEMDENKCVGQKTAEAAEACTPDGEPMLDENCNDQVDEGCACTPDKPCYSGPAASKMNAPCHGGKIVCADAMHGSCMDEVTPEVETCENQGVDDDCDGKVDNVPMIGTSCAAQSTRVGACKTGARWQCKDGKQTCIDGMMTPERCDGQKVDEDCDGKVDEGFKLSEDEENCGACGVTCGTGLTCCSGSCVSTASSNANCGACGNACPALNGCNTGQCKLLGAL